MPSGKHTVPNDFYCFQSMTLRDRKKAVDGDTGQAERLLLQKQSPKNSDQRDPRVKCVDA